MNRKPKSNNLRIDASGKRYRFNQITGSMEDVPFKELFLKGPISMDWLSRAAALPGKALHLAIAIQWLAGMAKTSVFVLTRKALALFDVGPDAKADALKRLENQGLIRVERCPGKRHRVEVLAVKEEQKSAVKPNDFGKILSED